MPHSVTTNQPLTELPKGGGSATQRVEAANTTVVLTDEEFARLPSNIFSSGKLTDAGANADPYDAVSLQAATVAAPAALTAPATFNATTYTATEVNALRNDVAALRTTVANLITALRGAGRPMA